MNRAVFLDRDGTIILEKNYLRDPAEVQLLPGAAEALQKLQNAGFLLFLITNQSGIGRGYFTVSDMERVHERLLQELGRHGVRLDRIYFAPEAPDQPSRGRKPSPQFLFDARDEFGVALEDSYVIGDKMCDLECGWNAGVKGSILVRTGYGREVEPQLSKERNPVVVDDLRAAATWILEQTSTAPAHRILGLIPARYASVRFPGKPLALIAGKPLIQHVVERCAEAKTLSEVIVATDDPRIAKVVQQFCRVEMTRPDHPSGSDRIAEVAARCVCDGVVNIQGDEPLIQAEVIDAVARALEHNPMTTAAAPLTDPAEYNNPNVVKVVVTRNGQALYFSRRTIPYVRDAAERPSPVQLQAFPFLKHLGIYGYRRQTLLDLVALPPSSLENAEKLEQLRALENGISIGVVPVNYQSVGVDVPEDIRRVEQLLKA